MKTLRRIFALIISVSVFLFLTYVFGIFMNPQGQGGWIAALLLIGTTSIGCLLLYGWIARGGSARLDRGVRTDAGSLGLGDRPCPHNSTTTGRQTSARAGTLSAQ